MDSYDLGCSPGSGANALGVFGDAGLALSAGDLQSSLRSDVSQAIPSDTPVPMCPHRQRCLGGRLAGETSCPVEGKGSNRPHGGAVGLTPLGNQTSAKPSPRTPRFPCVPTGSAAWGDDWLGKPAAQWRESRRPQPAPRRGRGSHPTGQPDVSQAIPSDTPVPMCPHRQRCLGGRLAVETSSPVKGKGPSIPKARAPDPGQRTDQLLPPNLAAADPSASQIDERSEKSWSRSRGVRDLQQRPSPWCRRGAGTDEAAGSNPGSGEHPQVLQPLGQRFRV
ncbi:hypothetical protein UY3_04268 [Chelonia mydas]|uniref:Uncharacterized protein n=1 Tax=Chelonia mydas TaxID=8469 RepID=M7CCP0_CHEMY|nr:hypothetical protein UY3_04268 [Chelonia mydas]